MDCVFTSSSFTKMPDLVTVRAKQESILERVVGSVAIYMVNLHNFWYCVKAAVFAFFSTENDESLSVDAVVFGWYGSPFFLVSDIPAFDRAIFSLSVPDSTDVNLNGGLADKAIFDDWVLLFSESCWAEFLETLVVAVFFAWQGCLEYVSAWTLNCECWLKALAGYFDSILGIAGMSTVAIFSPGRNRERHIASNTDSFSTGCSAMSGDVIAVDYRADFSSAATGTKFRALAYEVGRQVFPIWRVLRGSVFGHEFFRLFFPFQRGSIASSWPHFMLALGFSQGGCDDDLR